MKDSRVLDYVSMVLNQNLYIYKFIICNFWFNCLTLLSKLMLRRFFYSSLVESNCLCPFQVSSLQYRKLDFEEFCAAAISVHQLEAMDCWEQHARRAYEFFEKDGNRPIMIEELASV